MADTIPEGITRDDVINGIKNFNGGTPHEFQDSTSYDLVFEGNGYPPKAILGLAASRINGKALTPRDFKGGATSKCFRILMNLGFSITQKSSPSKPVQSKRNPPWTRDELIVALNFYFQYPKIPGKKSPEIIGLSDTLRTLNERMGVKLTDDFRSVHAVDLKLRNFRALDPGYAGVGMRAGGKGDKSVWESFYERKEELEVLAERIVDHVCSDTEVFDEVDPIDEEEAEEGKLLYRIHRYRERDTKIVKRKKAWFKKQNGRLFCEGCGFDFEKVYGQRGADYIECHHTKPVSELIPGQKTNISDLALVCSNCHRMIHRKKEILSIKELRALVISGNTSG